MNSDSRYNDAILLAKNKEYVESFNLFKDLAVEGNIKAMTNLGLCYLYGNGVEQNANLGFDWLSQAAIRQDEDAYYYVGYCYEMGYGVPQNDTQAILWYKTGAKAGQTKAMVALGKVLLNTDIKQATYWFLEAAKLNDVKAMLKLAKLNENKDNEEMLNWLLKAARLGNGYANYKLGKYYYFNDSAKNETLAELYLMQAAELGYIDSYILLGKGFLTGVGLKKNAKKAFSYLKKAYQNGNEEAIILLADCYYQGIGTKKDALEAKRILELAVRDNNSNAMVKLADYCSDLNENSFYDPFVARFWYEKAGILGNQIGMIKNAQCYENKFGTNKVDLDEAYYWYEKASLAGNLEATEKLKDFKKTIFGHYKLKKKRK